MECRAQQWRRRASAVRQPKERATGAVLRPGKTEVGTEVGRDLRRCDRLLRVTGSRPLILPETDIYAWL